MIGNIPVNNQEKSFNFYKANLGQAMYFRAEQVLDKYNSDISIKFTTDGEFFIS